MNEVKDLIRQRRFQAFAIEADSLVEFFQISEEGHVRIPLFDTLPNDALLWRTWHDPESDSFIFLFLHKSFASVPVGGRPMIRPASYHLVELIPAGANADEWKKTTLGVSTEDVQKAINRLRNVKGD